MKLNHLKPNQLERILRRLRRRVFDCPAIERRGMIEEVKAQLAPHWRNEASKTKRAHYHWMYACE